MQVPREKIEEILSRTDIALLIGQYVTLKPAGKNLKGLCPFHNEKTPSFNVQPQRGFFKCFGCGESGDAIRFLMKIENLSFPEALKILADQAGIVLRTTPQEKKIISEKKLLRNVLKSTVKYYHDLLISSPLGKKGLAYIRGRGLDMKTIQEFQLGYAPSGGDFLIKHLRSRKISFDLMEKAGIARRGRGDYYDYFRDRIIFPISDSQGRPIALAGRSLSPDVKPKYLNTPESSLFLKRNVLYGLSQAKSAIRKQKEVYVVEGYMDAIVLHQGGFQNVVASMGTSLTDDQARAISRYTRMVIFAYDADVAGAAATVRGIEIFEKAGLYVKVMEIPPGEDPDSILQKKGKSYFLELTSRSRGIIDYKIDHLLKKYNLDTPEGKQDFTGEVVPILREIKGEVRRSEYIRILSERHRISEEVLTRLVGNRRSRKKLPDTSPTYSTRLKLPEELILNCLLRNPKFIPICREFKIDEKCMRDDLFKIFVSLVNADLNGIETITADKLSGIIEDETLLKTAIDLLMKEGAGDCSEEHIRIFLSRIEQMKIKQEREKSFQEKLAMGILNYDDPDFVEYITSLKKTNVPGRNVTK